MRVNWWPAILVVFSAAAAVAFWGDAPPRPFVILGFMLVCPGMALARFLGIEDKLQEFVTGVALSLALESALATFMVYTDTWSPALALGLLVSLCVLSALGQLLRGVRRAERSTS